MSSVWMERREWIRDTRARERESQTDRNSFTNAFENYWLDISSPAHLRLPFTFQPLLGSAQPGQPFVTVPGPEPCSLVHFCKPASQTHSPSLSLLPQIHLSTLFQGLVTPRSSSHTQVLLPQQPVTPVIMLHTHAVVATVDLQVLRRADTCVVSQGVVAGARATDVQVHRAFIHICRGQRHSVQEWPG